MPLCHHCKAELGAADRFCTRCGTRQDSTVVRTSSATVASPVFCTQCGSPWIKGNRFCIQCGHETRAGKRAGGGRRGHSHGEKKARALLYVIAVVAVICFTIVKWNGSHRHFTINLNKVGDAFADGLKNDPFYDKNAGIIDILKRRAEILVPPEPGAGNDTRESRLKLLYMLTLGEINSIGSQTDSHAKYELRKSAGRYAARGLIELKELHDTSFDSTRFEANLRFLGALAWVLDGGMPDGPCLEDLKFSNTHDGDYRKAAAEVLAHVPNEDEYTAGLRAMGNKDFAAAEKAFTTQLKYFPDDYEALRWRGQSRLLSGAFKNALE